MTVPSSVAKSGPYNCNGVTDVFNYDFRIVDKAHLNVILTDAADAETSLTLTTHYTVSDVGSATGSINLTAAGVALAITGTKLTILRNPPFTQETDLQNQGAYLAETVEDRFDLLTMQIQTVKERSDRSIAVPASDDATTIDELTADLVTVAGIAGDVSTVAANVTAVNTAATNIAAIIDAPNQATAAAGSASAAATSETNAGQSELDAQTAQQGAESARDAAAGYAAGLNLPPILPGDADKQLYVKLDTSGYELRPAQSSNTFATKAAAEAYAPAVAPDFMRTAGYSAAGDGGGALYKKNGTATGALVITLSDTVTNVGYDLADAQPAKTPVAIAAMKALPAGTIVSALLTDEGREGLFVWDASDLSTEVAADAQGGVYVAPGSAPTGASGAWVRKYAGSVSPSWFGAVGDGATDDTSALQNLLDTIPAKSVIDLGGKTFKYTTLAITKDVTMQNGALTSATASGVQITVAPAARLTARKVVFTGGGSEATFVNGHYIISQTGASSASRGVGIDLEGCALSGTGHALVWSQFSDGHRFVGNKFSNFAYASFLVLSCDKGVARENRFEGRNAVGTGGNAYGLAITHDSTNYSSDPNAGTPQAANPFSSGWIVIGNTVIAPKIWEGIDFHGSYGSIVADNKVYGAATGIICGTGSGAAANYAGYDNIVTGNLVTVRNEDGSAVSGLIPVYGIVVNGGSGSSHKRVNVTNNIVVGYGGQDFSGAPSNAIAAIRVDNYVEDFIVSGNVVIDWLGTGVGVSTGAGSGIINNNVFSGMRSALASSACVRFSGTAPGRYQVIGNVLNDGGTVPAFGCVNSSSVTGQITYGSDFRRATTEVGGGFTAPGARRVVQYV